MEEKTPEGLCSMLLSFERLTRIGNVDASAEFSRDINLGLSPKTQVNLRVVVIVQEPEVGRVWGAVLTRLSNQY